MIICTGHRGFIGTQLVKLIPNYIGLDIKEGNDILSCELLNDSDCIIHLAAQSRVLPSISDPEHDAMTNILGTIRLANEYKHSRFIFTSSEGAIQKEIKSPYGLSKLCAEKYIKLLVKDYVILRLPNVYGMPGSGSVVDKFIYNDKLVINGDGLATRDYVHVYDIARAIKSAITWPRGTYHLGTGKYHSVLDLAKATGKPYTFGPAIEGEVQHTKTKNDWPFEPEVDVIDYIRRAGKGGM